MKISWQERLENYKNKDVLEKNYKAYHFVCADSIIHFINNYAFTYDPRKTADRDVPFELFPRQEEMVRFIWGLVSDKEEGVIDKTRGCGFSWVSAAISVYCLVFINSFTVSIYSYKETEVHTLGDIDSLLEKCIYIIDKLPEMFKEKIEHKMMQISNKKTGSIISGKSGPSPGRGGRSSLYFLDEAAWYPQAELIEAAVSRNSDVKVWGSTHHGTNTLFYRKSTSGLIPVFTVDWFEIPLYTQEWFDKEKEKAESQGLMHVFNQEVLRDASASVDSVVIPSAWVKSAIQSSIENKGKIIAGFDVANEGADTNALTVINGNSLIYCDEMGGADPGDATDRFFWKCVKLGVSELRYDSIGVGAGVKVRIKEIMSSLANDHPAKKMQIIPWNAGGAVLRPNEEDFEGIKNRDMFENAKAAAYWRCRVDFLQTHRMVEGKDCDESRVIFFPEERSPLMEKLIRELSQPQYTNSKVGKLMIKKQPEGTKSPNLCDSFILATAEVKKDFQKWTII